MQATCCCMFTSCRTHVNTFMHANIMLQSHKPITCTIAYFTLVHYSPLHATCKLHMCMFTVHSGCVYVHAACAHCVHDGIIHAWNMCLCNDLHVACCVRDASVHCMCMCVVYCICMCVWWAFMWHLQKACLSDV